MACCKALALLALLLDAALPLAAAQTTPGAPAGQVLVPAFPPLPAGVPPLPRFVPGPAPLSQAGPSPPGRPTGLIRVSGIKFVDDDCNEWLPTGWNSYNDLTVGGAAAAMQLGNGSAGLTSADDPVTRRFATAAASKLNLVRLFASQGSGGGALEPSPGVFDEDVFRGIDYVLAQAARFGIRVIIALNNYFDDTDGVTNYVEWANLPNEDAFFNSSVAQTLYQAHIRKVLTRVNVFNGRTYSEDPAILAWNVINEPRNPASQIIPGNTGQTTAFINTTANFIKSIDPYHLVTVGEEGFWALGSPFGGFNPWGGVGVKNWSYATGQDFSVQHALPAVDFAGMHLWPDNWAVLADTGFPARWIEGHNLAAAALGKPLLLEEFGNIATGDAANLTRVRDPLYRTVYQAVAASLAAGRPLRGASFWEWAQEGSDRAQRAVDTTDTAWRIIAQSAALANASSGTPVAGCVAVGAAAAASPAAPPLTPAKAAPPKAAPSKAAPPIRLPVVLPAPPAGASLTVLPTASGLLAQPFVTPSHKVPAAAPPPPDATLADSGAGPVLTAGG